MFAHSSHNGHINETSKKGQYHLFLLLTTVKRAREKAGHLQLHVLTVKGRTKK